jgi:hypothetical protein
VYDIDSVLGANGMGRGLMAAGCGFKLAMGDGFGEAAIAVAMAAKANDTLRSLFGVLVRVDRRSVLGIGVMEGGGVTTSNVGVVAFDWIWSGASRRTGAPSGTRGILA